MYVKRIYNKYFHFQAAIFKCVDKKWAPFCGLGSRLTWKSYFFIIIVKIIVNQFSCSNAPTSFSFKKMKKSQKLKLKKEQTLWKYIWHNGSHVKAWHRFSIGYVTTWCLYWNYRFCESQRHIQDSHFWFRNGCVAVNRNLHKLRKSKWKSLICTGVSFVKFENLLNFLG